MVKKAVESTSTFASLSCPENAITSKSSEKDRKDNIMIVGRSCLLGTLQILISLKWLKDVALSLYGSGSYTVNS